ncbi:unnamed protein product [Polarella glacialis]|uniref:EF-hand domain-containing protein n=1 Tax=Polarella glacialis TaxID=89957 RepID=A0A813KQD9_POLGL|nr:unnamed protein product [Polarella glacialis]
MTSTSSQGLGPTAFLAVGGAPRTAALRGSQSSPSSEVRSRRAGSFAGRPQATSHDTPANWTALTASLSLASSLAVGRKEKRRSAARASLLSLKAADIDVERVTQLELEESSLRDIVMARRKPTTRGSVVSLKAPDTVPKATVPVQMAPVTVQKAPDTVPKATDIEDNQVTQLQLEASRLLTQLQLEASRLRDLVMGLRRPATKASAVSSLEADREALFKSFDLDGSGAIDDQELLHSLRKLGLQVDAPEASEILRALDTNGDGMLQLEEFDLEAATKLIDQWRAAERAAEDASRALEKQSKEVESEKQAELPLRNDDVGLPTRPESPVSMGAMSSRTASQGLGSTAFLAVGGSRRAGSFSRFATRASLVSLKATDIDVESVTQLQLEASRLRELVMGLRRPATKASAVSSLEADKEALFQSFDLDGSGAIDDKELLHSLRKLGLQVDAPEASEILKALDTNGDGMLQLEEFDLEAATKLINQWRAAERAAEDASSALERQSKDVESEKQAELPLRSDDVGLKNILESLVSMGAMSSRTSSQGLGSTAFLAVGGSRRAGSFSRFATRASLVSLKATDIDVESVTQLQLEASRLRELVMGLRRPATNASAVSVKATETVLKATDTVLEAPVTVQTAADTEVDPVTQLQLEAAKLRADISSLEVEREERLERDRRALFRSFDLDGSGAIDDQELLHSLRKLGLQVDAPEASEILKALDTNGDGQLQLEEFDLEAATKLIDQWRAAERAADDAQRALERQSKEVESEQQAKQEALANLPLRNDDVSALTRLGSVLAYLLPLIDVLKFALPLALMFPILQGPFNALFAISGLLMQVPFGLGYLAVFVAMQSLAKNTELPTLLRFNLRQAVILDIALFVPNVLGGVVSLAAEASQTPTSEELSIAGNSIVFLLIAAGVAYSTVKSLNGQTPSGLPYISQMAGEIYNDTRPNDEDGSSKV